MTESTIFSSENVWIVFSGVANHLLPEPPSDEKTTTLNPRALLIRRQLRELRAVLFKLVNNNKSIQDFSEHIVPALDPSVVGFVQSLWKTPNDLLEPVAKDYREYQSTPSIRGGDAYYDPSTGQYDDEYYESSARLDRLRSERYDAYREGLTVLAELVCPEILNLARLE
ncbi:hypothetical protein KKC45_04245 [Patescibacteria group bacterium]|nr:hypothetical protein [Patescibacteria group bacterium]